MPALAGSVGANHRMRVAAASGLLAPLRGGYFLNLPLQIFGFKLFVKSSLSRAYLR